MSTRSNVVLDYYPESGPSQRVYLYRHSDGYPSWNGRYLAKFLRRWGRGFLVRYASAFKLAADLIRHSEGENPSYRGGGLYHPYEPTDGIHGDIEYLYRVQVRASACGTIHAIRAGWAHVEIGTEAPAVQRVPMFDVPTFRYQVARETRAWLKRIRAYEAQRKAAEAV